MNVLKMEPSFSIISQVSHVCRGLQGRRRMGGTGGREHANERTNGLTHTSLVSGLFKIFFFIHWANSDHYFLCARKWTGSTWIKIRKKTSPAKIYIIYPFWRTFKLRKIWFLLKKVALGKRDSTSLIPVSISPLPIRGGLEDWNVASLMSGG